MAAQPERSGPACAREELLYDMLCDLAREGAPLPRIPDFGPALGVVGHGSVYHVLDRLEVDGRIVVQGFATCKVIHLPALGLSVSAGAAPHGGCRRPLAEIVELVARVACLSVDELTGPRRTRLQTRPRYVAIRLARGEGWSFDGIGKVLHRDHSSIINGWAKSEIMLSRDKLFARLMRRAEAELAGMPEPAFAVRLRPAPLQVQSVARRPIEVDESDPCQVAELRRRRRGSAALLAAIQREYPERRAA